MRLRRFGFAIAALAGALATASCSLLTDLSGTSNGVRNDAAPGPDGTSPGSDGSAPTADAGTDGPPVDATTTDAGSCLAMNTVFCDDFERADPGDVKGTWSIAAKGGASASLDIEGSVGKRVLRASVGGGDAGAEPVAYVERSFNAKFSQYVIGADVFFDSTPAFDGEYRIVWKISYPLANGGTQLFYLAVQKSGAFVVWQELGSAPQIFAKDVALPRETKTNVRLDMTVAGRSRVFVNGALVHDIDTPAWVVGGAPSVETGIVSGPFPASSFSVSIDNFVFGGD